MNGLDEMDEQIVTRVLGALAKRFGGTIEVDVEETEPEPRLVIDIQEGKFVIHLLPDFVVVDVPDDLEEWRVPPEPADFPFKYLGVDPGQTYVGTRPDLYVDNSDSFRGGTISGGTLSASPWRSMNEQREPPPGKSFLDGMP